MYVNGRQIKDIVTYLNDNGVRSSQGKPIGKTTVTALLQNRKYIGEYQYRDVVVPNGVPAIISKELFALLMVAELVEQGYLLQTDYLLKDGSLEYRVHNISNKRDLERFRNNYRFVVGVSKSFNPEYCVDKNGRNNSDMIANLATFIRTPVSKYYSDRIGNICFAVWFVRVRDRKYTDNTFDGVLKIEKILVNDVRIENGLDSMEVDLITANIINERNPVCYGADKRRANLLYPVYVTESYLKSKYLGDSMFLNLF